MTIKKVTPQVLIGQSGANLIEQIVLQMKYVWRPLLIFDIGIDGEIEICDPVTGEGSNSIVRVQVKATTASFQAETMQSFEYSCEQKDLDYWLKGNTPVILIICRPDTKEAYWIPIKEYFKDLSLLKQHKVFFNKSQNRFTSECAELLKQLALPRDLGIYFIPIQKKEILYTNLLQVDLYAPKIHVANTDYRNRTDIWNIFKSMGTTSGPEWILSNRQIISFHDLHEKPFADICNLNTYNNYDFSNWANTIDNNKKREFVHLLKSMFEREDATSWIKVF